MTPHADGPDWSHYQTLTGKPVDPAWFLWSYKCSEGGASGDGKPAVDRFKVRWAWARERDFRYRGAYHWLRADASIAMQAANLYRRIDMQGGLQRGEFVQCDWEVTQGVELPTSLMAAEWCDRVQQHFGRACVIMYSSDWLPDSTLDADSRREFEEWRDENPTFPYWHANYNTSDRPDGGWVESAKYGASVWQWTNSFVHASVVGKFDMNHVFDTAVLDAITDQTPQPIVPRPPVVTNPEVLPVEYFVRFKGFANVFHVGAGGAVHVDASIAAKGKGVLGDPVVVDHRETKASICHAAGIPEGFLTPTADGS